MLHEIEPLDVVHFRNWLLENKSRDLARRTLSSFHSILIEMKQLGHIKSDPAIGINIKSGGRIEEHKIEKDIPSDYEIKKLLQAADELGKSNGFMGLCWARYRPMIYLATFSGMRPSECRGLTWDDVYIDRVEIRQRADKTGILGAVKSRAGKRTIYLPQIITKMIFDWKSSCPESELNLVFPTDSGKAQLLSNIRRGAWVPLMKAAGLVNTVNINGKEKEKPKYSLYALRHYYASKLIEEGVDLKFIQETMGHSKIEITFNVYGHLLKDREAARKETVEKLVDKILDFSANNKDDSLDNPRFSCGNSVASEGQCIENT